MPESLIFRKNANSILDGNNSFISGVVVGVIGLTCLLFIVQFCIIIISPPEYTYLDMNGNTGIAEDCYTIDTGEEMFVCEYKDTKFSVEKYTLED